MKNEPSQIQTRLVIWIQENQSQAIFIGASLVSWKTKKQQIVSRFSTEVEDIVMGTIMCEVVWLVSLLKDFQIEHSQAILFHWSFPCSVQLYIYFFEVISFFFFNVFYYYDIKFNVKLVVPGSTLRH